MRKSETGWEGERARRGSKSKWERARGRGRECMRAGNSDCKSKSEGKSKQGSKNMRACGRRRPCLQHSVMSAVNNRCKKLSWLQWTLFWPTYYSSQTWPNTVGLEHWSSATNTVFKSNINYLDENQFKKKTQTSRTQEGQVKSDTGWGFLLLVIHTGTVCVAPLPPLQSTVCKHLLIKWHHGLI